MSTTKMGCYHIQYPPNSFNITVTSSMQQPLHSAGSKKL